MRRTACFFLLFFFLAGSAQARQPQDKRRIEEEKRNSLAPTEAIRHPEIVSELPPEKKTDLSFLSWLSHKKTATFEDACHVLVILLGQQERGKDFSSQLSFLRENNILPPGTGAAWRPAPLRRGMAAYMFCQALGIKGGIMLRLFGASQRYCLAELAYEEIMSAGSTTEIISGRELVGIFSNAAEYLVDKIQKQGGRRFPASASDHPGLESSAEYRQPKLSDRLLLDYGGWVNARYIDYGNVDKDRSTSDEVDYRVWQDTRLWAKLVLKPEEGASYENTHSFYIRVKNLYSDNRPKDTAGGDDNDGPHLDYAYATLDLRPAWIRAGRAYFSVGQGIAYSDTSDGVEGAIDISEFRLKAFASRSLPRQDNIDTSIPGYDKHTRRFFYGAEAAYQGVPGHTFYAYTLIQRDKSDPEPDVPGHDFRYDSEYYGLGGRGKAAPELSYWWELIGEKGKSFIFESNEKKNISAWAAIVALRYEPQVYSHPSFRFKYAYASGDGDRGSVTDTENGNAAGKDKNFLYFGFIPTGYALSPQVSNLQFIKGGYYFTPFEKVRFLKNLSLGLDYYRFYKTASTGGIDDEAATEDKYDIGQEVDATIDWQICSDLNLAIEYGCFFPGAAYPRTAHDKETYFSVSTTFTF